MTKFLRRYTNLLKEQKITLLDPESWEDKNDSHFMSLYRKKKSLKSVLALCFTQASETFHHWRVFADGTSGICIQYKRLELIDALSKQSGVKCDAVRYLKLTDLKNRKLKTDQLPFRKRFPYGDESEFRVVYESKIAAKKFLDISIPLSSVDRITLSPWLPVALRGHVESTIRAIKGCDSLKIVRSTLISNEQWKNLGENAR